MVKLINYTVLNPANLGFGIQINNNKKTIIFPIQLTENCGAPCNSLFFNDNERTVLRYWVGSWAAVCVASCLFTVSFLFFVFMSLYSWSNTLFIHTDSNIYHRFIPFSLSWATNCVLSCLLLHRGLRICGWLRGRGHCLLPRTISAARSSRSITNALNNKPRTSTIYLLHRSFYVTILLLYGGVCLVGCFGARMVLGCRVEMGTRSYRK